MYQTQDDIALPPRTRSQSFHLDAPLLRVFPLFTARGEREWAPGWDPIMLSGGEQRGSAFETRSAEGLRTTWIVVDYRPAEGRASYARLAHGSHIGLVDVICSEPGGGGTNVSVAYTLTPLNEQGEAFIDAFLEPESYSQMIEEWRAATSAALGVSGGHVNENTGQPREARRPGFTAPG